jgi:hypothetical protein
MTRALSVAACALAFASVTAEAQTRLPGELRVENLRPANLVSLEILDGEGKVIARLARPVAGGKKAQLRLQRANGCDMTVQAKFDDDGEVEETLNLCRERVLRFRE